MKNRYSRQLAFHGIGIDGQKKLLGARIAIVGMGALGTAAADRLCRAGIGYLRLIDHDIIEQSNLQRQMLYLEADIGKQKSIAAAECLRAINSGIEIEAVYGSVTDDMLTDIDVVLDCTDNSKARRLINRVCHAVKIPWVHGAAAGSGGVVFPIVPGGACFSCLYPDDNTRGETAATLGVLGTITAVVGAYQANEAIRLLLGMPPSPVLMLDMWNNICEYVEVKKKPDCPVCGAFHDIS